MAVSLERLGKVALQQQNPARARQYWLEELQMANSVMAQVPSSADWPRFTAVVHLMLSQLSDDDAATHRSAAYELLAMLESSGRPAPRDRPLFESLAAASRI